jgi:hypothetical protein
MKDMFGATVEVGDLIAYAKGGQEDTGIYTGTIKRIEKQFNTEGVIVGRNTRVRTSEVIILLKNYSELMKENYPELFI